MEKPPKNTHEAGGVSEPATPEYWPGNPPFKSPKKYYELQFSFAKLIAGRRGIPLTQAVKEYAPIVDGGIHEMDDARNTGELLEGVTEENMLERAWQTSQERRARFNTESTPYHSEKNMRFGCHSYDYDERGKSIGVHFSNAEADENFVDGKDISKGPLSEGKVTRRFDELKQMFTEIKRKYPEVKYVHGCSNLYNLPSYKRLYPKSYADSVGDTYQGQEVWSKGMGIWGQFLGGNDKVPGEFGFKQELADAFLEKVKDAPLDKLADALPMPPREAHGNIQDFYDFYGIKDV